MKTSNDWYDEEDADIYMQTHLAILLEEELISDLEEGFMQGYLAA